MGLGECSSTTQRSDWLVQAFRQRFLSALMITIMRAPITIASAVSAIGSFRQHLEYLSRPLDDLGLSGGRAREGAVDPSLGATFAIPGKRPSLRPASGAHRQRVWKWAQLFN
ncbi:hypothetical protein GY26_11495 [Gammaproteobacteria bacterium MFB021]|nr:hypothetical protein GY26_11495 [Gammaproteobacteria bacterium MFB021]